MSGGWTRQLVPLEWATAQNNLGNALSLLGEREVGTARLEQAVTAYRAALEEWTRDRLPLDWATTQNNLGNALRELGAREAGTARLLEAVGAYNAVLEEWTRDRVPLDWAGTTLNKCLAEALIAARRDRLDSLAPIAAEAAEARAVMAEAGHAPGARHGDGVLGELQRIRAVLSDRG